uniref:vesicle transport protein GOT1A n=1 Tax=Nyctereutes procyonoides TaxID=34880 RepID=UPI002443A6CB|nr:vesicle transport protein GOT1A [Nyctereutes procyonoides]
MPTTPGPEALATQMAAPGQGLRWWAESTLPAGASRGLGLAPAGGRTPPGERRSKPFVSNSPESRRRACPQQVHLVARGPWRPARVLAQSPRLHLQDELRSFPKRNTDSKSSHSRHRSRIGAREPEAPSSVPPRGAGRWGAGGPCLLQGQLPWSRHRPGPLRSSPRGSCDRKAPQAACGMISISEWQKIGVGTTGFGIFFILFGIFLYFDSVLLAFGNLLFLTGLLLIIGLRKTFSFFFQRHKLKGTSFFLGGVVIVLLRWPLLGMLLETYGFLSLFKGFFPVVFGFLGNASDIPFLSALFRRLQGTSSMV